MTPDEARLAVQKVESRELWLSVAEVVNEAVAREREDCAQIAEWERGSLQVFLSDSPVPGKVCDSIAAAIRARGKGEGESGGGL